ncbi:response regulator [Nocardia takedensis]|uniref:response regulator n=1 Tax=Nocardia takedensis TaxID=259390 RepID=UPI003F76A351
MSQYPSRRSRPGVSGTLVAGVTVLVVEDDRATAEMIEIVLAGIGLGVHVCTRGEPAASTARRIAPVLVLVDLMLPDLGGAQVCRALREHCATPIVSMSASRDPEVIAAAATAGAEDHLVKPFTMRQLLHSVTAHLPPDPIPGLLHAPSRTDAGRVRT